MSEATDTGPVREALEQVAKPRDVKTVLDLLERMKPELAKALPQTIGVERFTRIVTTELHREPKLLECAPESLLGAMMLAAQLGLEPGPLGLVYLIPFKHQVEFVVGYRGYVELALRSGMVKDVFAANVLEGDDFDYVYGTQPKLTHRPMGADEEREIIASYAVARLRSGGAPFIVTYHDDWERARTSSALGKKNLGPWRDERAAMIRKTSVRRLEPFLPKTPALARAFVRDETEAPMVDESTADIPE
jgi:recombination protein RecT